MEEEDISKLKERLAVAEQKARDSEAMMIQAAEYGKDLLEKNIALESNFDTLQQEKHELHLKLQAKSSVEKSLLSEAEHLREAAKQLEDKLEARNAEEEEKWGRREEIWKAKLSEAEVALQAAESKVTILKERIEVSDKQLQEAAEAMNQSVGGQSLSTEFAELHAHNVDLLKEKQSLECEVARARVEAQEAAARQQAATARVELVSRELEEAQCSISSYCRAVEAAKTEAAELQAQLDAVAINDLNEDGKGNSLFSEVNDRREKVETQLKVYEEKFAMLKSNYDVKLAELQKTKMHNAKLLSIAGSSVSDSGHAARLEELLATERNKNKSLRERLDTMEQMSLAPSAAVSVPMLGGGAVSVSDDSTVVVPHTQSDEYSYLSTLLADTQRTNAQLQKQLQDQFRLSLEDSDKIREMTRKVNQLETSVQKMKAENYTLKINIDELKCKKGEQKVARKEPVLIHEKLVFEKKKDNEEKRTENQFVLKENISHKASTTDSSSNKPTMVENVASSGKENIDGGCGEKPRKKMATFADDVESISAEGEKGREVLAAASPDREKARPRPSKPQGRKKFGAANTVFVGEQDTQAECKQQ